MINLNEYFNKNYFLLIEWAENIYSKTEIDSGDVVAELFLDLKKRELPNNEEEMKFYILRWLKSRLYWQGGNQVKNYRIPERSSNNTILKEAIDYNSELDEVGKDLHRAGFNEWEIKKITSCIDISKKMPLYFKRLFVLYYIDGLTMEEIGNSCGLPKSAIFTQLKKIKKYLKEHLKIELESKVLEL